MRSIWTVLGSCWRIDSRNALPSGQRGRITVPAKHFFSETLRLPRTGIAKMRPEHLCWPILGLCWPIWGLCWGHVRPSWGYVGAMLPHLGLLLDHVVGDVGPLGAPRGDFGLCCFHDFTFIPKILLEKALPSGLRSTRSIFATLFLWKSWILPGTGAPPMSAWRLPPVACEVPGNASRGLEKRSAVQGGFPVAEAKVQATTSLPLHGMAGLYGLRPAPAMPGQRRVENNNFIVACEVPGNSRPIIHEVHLNRFGVMLKNWL